VNQKGKAVSDEYMRYSMDSLLRSHGHLLDARPCGRWTDLGIALVITGVLWYTLVPEYHSGRQ